MRRSAVVALMDGEREGSREVEDPMTETTPQASSVPGGLVYADVPNRAIAYIIDAIILAVIIVVVAGIVAAIGFAAGGFISAVVIGIIGLAISAAYFIYTWTTMRATVGMKALGMQIGNAGDGKTLTTDQAIRRWLALSAPSILAQAFQPIAVIGLVLSIAAFAWFIYLVYSTAQSPTKQGWHDVFATTMVVKAAKSVA